MALTKVSGPLLHGSNDNLGNYVVNNITGAAATFTSNVSVGGTLTYDDVTSVESVGLITAKSGIHVTGGSVRVGNTTTTANGNADNLVIGEITGNHGITILSGQNAVGNLFFGDIVNNSAAGIQYFHADNHMEFRIAGGEKVRFNSAGDVGIGTTNPYTTGAASRHKLTVAADDVLGIGRANIDMFYVRREYEAGKYTFQTINGGNSGNFNFQPFGGVVGIGTKTPATSLHVTSSSASAIPLTVERTHNNNVIVEYKNRTASMYAGLAGDGLGWSVGNGVNLGAIANNMLMVRRATGNIGIGTLVPESKLTVAVDSASAIIELKRTNTNTTGSFGALSWTAMDGHSVANMYALGDGDNEGAHLVFRTTSAAASNDPYNAATEERLRILSTGGITFNGDTAAANALNDYEEGSWTPTVLSEGNIGTSTYGCTYTKIGRLVTINADIAHLTDTTSSTFIKIGGLPYVPSGTVAREYSAVCHGERYSGGDIIVAYILYNSGSYGISFRFGVPTNHFSYVKHSHISDNGDDNNLRFTLTYEIT